jgi:hypothetical protein
MGPPSARAEAEADAEANATKAPIAPRLLIARVASSVTTGNETDSIAPSLSVARVRIDLGIGVVTVNSASILFSLPLFKCITRLFVVVDTLVARDGTLFDVGVSVGVVDAITFVAVVRSARSPLFVA